jgi:hypothetical protein
MASDNMYRISRISEDEAGQCLEKSEESGGCRGKLVHFRETTAFVTDGPETEGYRSIANNICAVGAVYAMGP